MENAQPHSSLATLAANKQTVLDFYERMLSGSDIEAATAYLGPEYIQHNPTIEDGVDGFVGFVRQLKERFPQVRSEIKRVFADGDFVVLHVHAKREPDEPGLAIIDIFRLAHGKIVEHWDVRQPVPEHSANNNGMF
ncbi:nuclear transport factor 2 family protein [Trinickia sp. LjRoot230]|uniref:nuclear transport factor 2 family protein n=1 Tax=Trinickia sp. LjRoot230 TaxID=3342288 RepID=UPI003ED0ED4C